MTLEGKNIAILLAPRGTEEPEFVEPKHAVEAAGALVTVIGVEAGEVQTVNNDLDPGSSFIIEKSVAEVSASDFNGLVIGKVSAVDGGCR